ncbi:site-specific integrase [Limosilactobacillus reuteri]|uniref:site-specific integrase n=1 Tax=Limosilactobacillus reuteri TaxID=1598 RepID=UPI001E45ADCF|nr:site-specific integrase [Limosilactobacillus reuteri]MCC4383329.1 site-specific integrase [Limosilactobacillus reuteri]MCC4420166.1 site-specific integrase [Limosilactobacillus reuteri]
MSVYKDKRNGTWYVKYRINGKSTSKRGFKLKSDAVAWEQEKAVELKKYGQMNNHNMTVEELSKKWLPVYEQTGIENSTIHKTKQIIKNHILPRIGNYKVADLSIELLTEVAAKWKEELVKSDPFNYTKRMLDYAVQLRAIPTNPMNSIVKPRKKHDKTFTNNNFFNEKQLHNFIKCIKKDYEEKNPRAFMVLWLALFTGMRKQELQALTWQDVKFTKSGGIIHINKAIKNAKHPYLGSPKTANSYRWISIDKKTASYLKRWKQQQIDILTKLGFNPHQKEQLIFSTYTKNKIVLGAELDKPLNKVIVRNNLKKVTFHGLRHTHATHLASIGTQPKLIADRLGDTMETVLEVYINADTEPEQGIADKFADSLV